MDHSDIEASLHSIIDPDLDTIQALQAVQTQDAFPSDTPLDIPDQPSTDTPPTDPSTKPPKPKRERKVVVRGSESDIRRREANKLAADRSRARAKERQVNLEAAQKALAEEKARLEAEIAKFDSHPQTLRALAHLSIEPAQTTADEFTGTSNDAQDSHSRTILAALMSAGSGHEMFGGVEGDDDAWMQGVEDMFKEAESSGRLSELAALAMGRNGPAGQAAPVESATTPMPVEPQIQDNTATEPADSIPQPDIVDETAQPSAEISDKSSALVFHKFLYSSTEAASRATTAMAVFLNAEMERYLRDDIVVSKAAITIVNKECDRIKELQTSSEFDSNLASLARDQARINALPDNILSPDLKRIQAEVEATAERIASLEASLPGLRESVKKTKEEKLDEEGKLATAVTELQGFMEGGSGGKEPILKLLKSVTGHVAHLLHGSPDESTKSAHPASASDHFSSPAIAHRRRGRPPVKGLPGAAQLGSPEKFQPQSTLAQSFSAEDVDMSTGAATGAPGAKSTGNADGSSSAELATHAASAAPEMAHDRRFLQELAQITYPQDADSSQHEVRQREGVTPTPEQYILSHLQDSSTFSRFLPQNHNGVDHASTSETAAVEADPAEDDNVITQSASPDRAIRGQTKGSGRPAPREYSPSILETLRKGPTGSCDICGRTETSVWRKLPLAGDVLKVCNACGLYHAKFGIIRPSQLWGDGISLKKRRAVVRPPKLNSDGTEMAPRAKKRKIASDVNGAGDEEDGNDDQAGGGGVDDEEVLDDVDEPVESGQALTEADTLERHIDPTLDDTFDGLDTSNMVSILGMDATDGSDHGQT